MSSLNKQQDGFTVRLPIACSLATAAKSIGLAAARRLPARVGFCRTIPVKNQQDRAVLRLRILCWLAWALTAWVSILSLREAAAQSPERPRDNTTHSTSTTVRQPRPFGYVIGDLLSQQVLLQRAGADFDLAELPAPRRVGVWFDRRAAKIERAADGRRWLRVDYQVINAPQKLASVSLPAWQIESKSGGLKLTIPSWPVSIAPLTPESAFVTGGLGELRPDRPAPVIATAPLRRQLTIALIAFIITSGAWFAWLKWRNWQASMHQPFARALREIQGLDETAPQAWQALHRAFDRTACRAVQADTLQSLFQRAPQLLALRSDIERFFAESSELFFGAGRRDSGFSVLTLCSELRRIEKRYEP